MTRTTIFISYAHADKRYLDQFMAQLTPLIRHTDMEVWSDLEIKMSQDWHEEIQKALNRASAAVLLVSAQFLSSTYVNNSELPVLLKSASDKGLKIFSIILSPCPYLQAEFRYPDPKTGPHSMKLSQLQAANSPTKTLTEIGSAGRDRIMLAVAQAVTALTAQPAVTKQPFSNLKDLPPIAGPAEAPDASSDSHPGPQPPVRIEPTRTPRSDLAEMEVRIDVPFGDFSPSEQDKFLRGVAEILGTGHLVRIKNVRPGSTIVTLELPTQDALQLSRAIQDGKLRDFRVIGWTLLGLAAALAQHGRSSHTPTDQAPSLDAYNLPEARRTKKDQPHTQSQRMTEDGGRLSQRRAQEIMGIAHTYWSGFLEATGCSPRSLFDRSAFVNHCALSFFRYCTEIYIGVPGATVVPTGLLKGSGSPSWLWHQGKGVPHILLDFDAIRATVQQHAERKTITWIILHEVGHLVMHLPNIASMQRGVVATSTEVEEQESWAFAGAVVALALAQSAPDRRPAIKDNAWILTG